MVSGRAVDGEDLVPFLQCLCPLRHAPGPQDLNEDGTATVRTSCESRGGGGEEGEGETSRGEMGEKEGEQKTQYHTRALGGG